MRVMFTKEQAHYLACAAWGLGVAVFIPGCRSPAPQPPIVAPSSPPVTPAPQPQSLNDQLMAAAGAGDTAAILDLLRRGADPNYTGTTGEPWRGRGTPLVAAGTNGRWAAAKLLLARGARVTPDVLLLTTKFMTWTVKRQSDYEETAFLLIEHGANVNAVAEWESSQDQYTALGMAAQCGSLRLVKRLLARGAALNRGEGADPLTRAKRYGHPELIPLLQRASRRQGRQRG